MIQVGGAVGWYGVLEMWNSLLGSLKRASLQWPSQGGKHIHSRLLARCSAHSPATLAAKVVHDREA